MGGGYWGSYSALAHAEYAQENGRVEYVTTYRPGKDFQGDELRLVKVVFKK